MANDVYPGQRVIVTASTGIGKGEATDLLVDVIREHEDFRVLLGWVSIEPGAPDRRAWQSRYVYRDEQVIALS